MKIKSIVLGLLAILSLSVMSFLLAGNTTVPQAVLDAFSAKFPQAQNVDWEEEEDGEYEAEFKVNKQEMSANFKADGTWLETEMEIKKSKLPAAVKKAIAAQFPGYEVEEAEQVETPDVSLAFEVELENEDTDTEVEAVFQADGTLLKKEMKKEHEDEEDENE